MQILKRYRQFHISFKVTDINLPYTRSTTHLFKIILHIIHHSEMFHIIIKMVHRKYPEYRSHVYCNELNNHFTLIGRLYGIWRNNYTDCLNHVNVLLLLSINKLSCTCTCCNWIFTKLCSKLFIFELTKNCNVEWTFFFFFLNQCQLTCLKTGAKTLDRHKA